MSTEPTQEQPQVEQMAVEESTAAAPAAPAATPAAEQTTPSQGIFFNFIQTRKNNFQKLSKFLSS